MWTRQGSCLLSSFIYLSSIANVSVWYRTIAYGAISPDSEATSLLELSIPWSAKKESIDMKNPHLHEGIAGSCGFILLLELGFYPLLYILGEFFAFWLLLKFFAMIFRDEIILLATLGLAISAMNLKKELEQKYGKFVDVTFWKSKT